MIIGIDARATVADAAGRGRVVSCLIRQLALRAEAEPELRFRLYTETGSAAWLEEDVFEWCPTAGRGPFWHRAVAKDANRTCSVFISTNSYLTTRYLKIPSVAIVYDLIPFHRAAQPRLRSRVIERLTLARVVKRSARLVAISKATAADLVENFPDAAAKTVVAQLAADDRPASDCSSEELQVTRDRYQLPKRFILITGTLEPRKNIPRLIDAYTRLDEEVRREHLLVVVGKRGWRTKEIEESMSVLGGQVRELGFVPDRDLFDLYRLCTLFCYPSLYEGFGLPVLEAMQCGAPVLTSDVSSLPEVGGDAAHYVDPLDVGSIRAGLELILTDPDLRQAMSNRGVERATQFSWRRFTDTVLTAAVQAGSKP